MVEFKVPPESFPVKALVLLHTSTDVCAFGEVISKTSRYLYFKVHAVKIRSSFGLYFHPGQSIRLNFPFVRYHFSRLRLDDMKFFTKNRKSWEYLPELSAKKIKEFYANR